MRGMIGGNGVNGAIGQAVFEGLDVKCRSQRRVDFVDSVKTPQAFITQGEVMRCSLSSDCESLGFCNSHHVHTALR